MTYAKALFFPAARHLALAVLASVALLSCSKKETDTVAPAGAMPATADATTAAGCPYIPAGTKAPGTTWDCGCSDYGPNSELAHNKQAYVSAGANHYFITSASIEVDNMNPNHYAYGDNKTGWSFNAGVTKQNWQMIVNSGYGGWHGQYGYGNQYYGPGYNMIRDRALDVRVYNQNVNHHGGIDRYLAGHRNGQTGLNNPNTNDIRMFQASWHWIHNQLNTNQAHYRDGVRFWVKIPAI